MSAKRAVNGICMVAAVCVATCGAVLAQSALPALSPTSAAQPSAPPDNTATPAAAPVHRAQVSYQMGQLTVIAENSSLDQILRDISRQIGMKITGNVTDQQVFGTYGPAAPLDVLRILLDGSGSNMLLRETAADQPTELVLTPAQGAPATPDENALSGAGASVQPGTQQPGMQPYGGYSGAPSRPFNAPQNGVVSSPMRTIYSSPPQLGPEINQPAEGPVSQPAAPAADNPQSPNGVRTPQQIYEQLQRLQQQQQQRPEGPQ